MKVPTQKKLAKTIMKIDGGRDDFGDWFEQGEVDGMWYHVIRDEGDYIATVYVEGNEAGDCMRRGKVNAICAAAQDAIEYRIEFNL